MAVYQSAYFVVRDDALADCEKRSASLWIMCVTTNLTPYSTHPYRKKSSQTISGINSSSAMKPPVTVMPIPKR